MTIKIPELDTERWLGFPFYKETCSQHPNKYKTFYCGTCNLQEPVCPICWRNISNQHPDDHHRVLTVKIASGRASTELTEIGEFIDVSGIQIYSINGKAVVYLKPDEKRRPSHSICQPNHCSTCRRKLRDDERKLGFKFCSIACKIEQCKQVSVGDHIHMEKKSDDIAKKIEQCKEVNVAAGDDIHMEMEIEKKSRDDANANKATAIKIKINLKRKISDECPPPSVSASTSASLRKRSRKGIPRRAPFF